MNKLVKVVTGRQKRKGRGYGSGKGGHTSGRGQKGQKSRGSMGIMFEGVKVRKSLFKRLPLLRGKGKFKAKPKPLTITLNELNKLPAGSTVDLELLLKHGVVNKDALKTGVKVLGNGRLEKKMKVVLPVTSTASEAIVKVGGEVVYKIK